MKQPLHKGPKHSHERMAAHVAMKIKNALRAPLSGGTEEKWMHKRDLQTTWLGISRAMDMRPRFQLYSRLMELTAESSESLPPGEGNGRASPIPGVVSFVGDTGAGKSSLIKLLIENQNLHSQPFQTPIVGSSTSIHATSEDIHLYSDPATAATITPILYADCEGLLGGDRKPLAAILKEQLCRRAGASMAPEDEIDQGTLVFEREITLGADHQSREYAVKNLYPRLLYIFSDVVVFVVRNSRYVPRLSISLILSIEADDLGLLECSRMCLKP